jgi:hypothetical protein
LAQDISYIEPVEKIHRMCYNINASKKYIRRAAKC